MAPTSRRRCARRWSPSSGRAACGRLSGACARQVGPNLDLVAVGGALRVHAVRDGALVRTCEALLLSHAADGAEHLLQAAAAYEALARTADAMAAAGGRLSEADDGFVQVRYGSTAP